MKTYTHHSTKPRYYCFKLGLLIIALIASPITLALSSDNQQPYHIKSDHAVYRRPQHTTTFEGHVVIEQGSTRMTGEKTVVYHATNSNKIIKLITTGHLAQYSTLPDGKTQRLYCQAKVIQYYPLIHHALLVGHAKASQAANSLSGQRIWYNLATQRVESMRSGTTQRNTLIVAPKQPPSTHPPAHH